MKKIVFYIGTAILVFLLISYFIPVYYTEIENGLPVKTESILLGEVIFHSPWILALYILVSIVLIVIGLSKTKILFDKMTYSEIFRVWKLVFGQPKYIFITLIIATGFYLANAVLANIQNYSVWVPELGFFSSFGFILGTLSGFHDTITRTTFYSIIFIGLLTGIFFSIIHCKFSITRKQEKSSSLISTIALFLGFLVPGCAACGVGVIALLGFGSSIAALPFQGTEISFLAIVLLVYSIIQATLSFARCSLPKKY